MLLFEKKFSMKTVRKREHFENFSIAGFTYYDGPIVFKELEIGTELKMSPEPENQFDKNAVVLSYKDFKLGYIPRSCNREISKVLNAGYNLFSAYIQYINPTLKPEEQVGVIVYIECKA